MGSRARHHLLVRNLANDRIAPHRAVVAANRGHGVDDPDNRAVFLDQPIRHALAALPLRQAQDEAVEDASIVGVHQSRVSAADKLAELGFGVAEHVAKVVAYEFKMYRIAQIAAMIAAQVVHDAFHGILRRKFPRIFHLVHVIAFLVIFQKITRSPFQMHRRRDHVVTSR